MFHYTTSKILQPKNSAADAEIVDQARRLAEGTAGTEYNTERSSSEGISMHVNESHACAAASLLE